MPKVAAIVTVVASTLATAALVTVVARGRPGRVVHRNSLESATLPPPAERLWIVTLSRGDIESEAQRIENECADPRVFDPKTDPLLASLLTTRMVACRQRSALRLGRVAEFRALPRGDSPIVAYVCLRPPVPSDPDWRFVVEPMNQSGRYLGWPDAEGYEYGGIVSGAQKQGDWVRLLTKGTPVDGWLEIKDQETSPILKLNVEAISIVNLIQLRATLRDGTSLLIEPGSYTVVGGDENSIQFRSEIPSDFSCGEKVVDPPVKPRTLTAPVSEFFNSDGTARFAETYTKGC